MNPSKFLTSVLLLFRFRQNSSVKVGMGGSMASWTSFFYSFVNSGMTENSKNKCSDDMVKQINILIQCELFHSFAMTSLKADKQDF